MKKDITRIAVEKAAARMSLAIDKIKATIPYGPEKVQMSPSEMRKALQGSRGEALIRTMESLGTDRFMELMNGRRQE